VGRFTGTIDNCVNNGNIFGDSSVGGIVGYLLAGSTVTNSTNNGTVTSNYHGSDANTNGSSGNGGYGVGGIAGTATGAGIEISGSTNNGKVTGTDSVAGVGAIAGSTGSGLSLDGNKYAEGSSDKGIGGYSKPSNDAVQVYVPTPPNPGNPNPPIITPNPGNSGGSSAGTPAPAAVRNPVRYVAPTAAVNAPVVAAVSPPSTADTTLPEPNVSSQPEIIGDLNVPTTVTEDAQSNNVLPIILIIVIVVVVAVLLLLGAKKRRQGGTES
jgi:hypothetical protein